jgi:hypothetical protein
LEHALAFLLGQDSFAHQGKNKLVPDLSSFFGGDVSCIQLVFFEFLYVGGRFAAQFLDPFLQNADLLRLNRGELRAHAMPTLEYTTFASAVKLDFSLVILSFTGVFCGKGLKVSK